MTDKDGHQLRLTKKVVKDIGKDRTGCRISDDAAMQVMAEAESFIEDMWDLAGELAEHAGRSTIQEEDVRLAAKIKKGEG